MQGRKSSERGRGAVAEMGERRRGRARRMDGGGKVGGCSAVRWVRWRACWDPRAHLE